MNAVQLIGRMTRDPELRSTQSGKSVCDMRLAVPRRDRDADPVYIDVSAWDGLAESCGQHLAKGRQVAVTGRLEYREFETDGQRRSAHSVVASEVEFLGPKPKQDDQDES